MLKDILLFTVFFCAAFVQTLSRSEIAEQFNACLTGIYTSKDAPGLTRDLQERFSRFSDQLSKIAALGTVQIYLIKLFFNKAMLLGLFEGVEICKERYAKLYAEQERRVRLLIERVICRTWSDAKCDDVSSKMSELIKFFDDVMEEFTSGYFFNRALELKVCTVLPAKHDDAVFGDNLSNASSVTPKSLPTPPMGMPRLGLKRYSVRTPTTASPVSSRSRRCDACDRTNFESIASVIASARAFK